VTDLIAAARRVAADVLAPTAEAADTSGVLPRANLDALAEAGLYGLGAGDESFVDVCRALEILAEADLTTAFVLSQHLGALQVVASAAPPQVRERWLEPMLRGERRIGAAFTGASLPGPALLHATPDGDGWRLDGFTPWISGWGLVDAMHVAGRAPDGRVVWALLDADPGAGLTVEPLHLLAVEASATVRATFTGVAMPAERVTQLTPKPTGAALVPHGTRVHAALSLGVASRCVTLLQSERLAGELDAVRAQLDGALDDPDAMALARAAVAELTIRAAGALLVRTGARGAVAEGAPQRLVREAHFLSVFGSRAPIKAALLQRLGA
jgi:alkylation response protein AidB-like acyl-CoA dehydrogenase